MVGDEKHKDEDIQDEEDGKRRMEPSIFYARAQEVGRNHCTYFSRYHVMMNV